LRLPKVIELRADTSHPSNHPRTLHNYTSIH
jgi:hypothetical protein